MARYIWQLPTWPVFRWDSDTLLQPLGKTRQAGGRQAGNSSERSRGEPEGSKHRDMLDRRTEKQHALAVLQERLRCRVFEQGPQRRVVTRGSKPSGGQRGRRTA